MLALSGGFAFRFFLVLADLFSTVSLGGTVVEGPFVGCCCWTITLCCALFWSSCVHGMIAFQCSFPQPCMACSVMAMAHRLGCCVGMNFKLPCLAKAMAACAVFSSFACTHACTIRLSLPRHATWISGRMDVLLAHVRFASSSEGGSTRVRGSTWNATTVPSGHKRIREGPRGALNVPRVAFSWDVPRGSSIPS